MLLFFSAYSRPVPSLNLLGAFAYLRRLQDEELIRGNRACFGFQVNEFSLAQYVIFMQEGNTLSMSKSELKC